VDFFNAISMLYGTLTECCTAESCPTMCAGPKYEYRWADGVKVGTHLTLLPHARTHAHAHVAS
jgi:hypothetical protein